jgi:outer membrane protein assembly factor BamB
MRRKLLAILLGLALLAAGLAVALVVRYRDRPSDHLDTALTGVTVAGPATTEAKPPPAKPKPKPKPKPKKRKRRPLPPADDRCWHNFGGNPQRTLARLGIRLGRPTKAVWARGLGSYMEYPPAYCDGRLYVNTDAGVTWAIDARTSKTIWKRKGPAPKPSSPAIAGKRVIVSSHDGTVTAYHALSGRRLWQLRTSARIESSPLVVGKTVYFG